MAKPGSTKQKKPAVPRHLAPRVKKLQSRLQADDMDGLIISNPHDIRYLTGFVGEDSWLWVPSTGSGLTVISDMRFRDHIPDEAPHVRVVMRKRSKASYENLAQGTARSLSRRSLKRVGVQASYLKVPERKQIVKEFSAKVIKDYKDGMLHQRSIKDVNEIKSIQQAVKIQQAAFTETREILKPGITELEVAGYLEYRMKCHGADGIGFNTIVAYDGHSSHNHAHPGRQKLKKNSNILIDWGAKYNGYVSDMTRVLNMGKPKKHIAEIYQIVEEALHVGIEKVAPGVSVKEVDDASRGVLQKYGHKLVHGLGHGIGLYVHEQPGLGQNARLVLEPGNVITIEPGIYLGAKGGVRLEDDILVTKTGAKNLSDLPTALEWSII
ncbi:MAG: Xaa-Pro peptidase family protein [Planctomycetota bacterium]